VEDGQSCPSPRESAPEAAMLPDSRLRRVGNEI
jgi:hypothetical protein